MVFDFHVFFVFVFVCVCVFFFFFFRRLLCFTLAIDLGHISDSLEACLSILVQELVMCDMLQMSHYTVCIVLLHGPGYE
jgi:hypothetical protein